jgi:hypothetical protein
MKTLARAFSWLFTRRAGYISRRAAERYRDLFSIGHLLYGTRLTKTQFDAIVDQH